MTLARMNKREKRRVLQANRGLLARVARQADVSEAAVHYVFWGASKSERIEALLDAELAAIEREA